jgi:hypothetical protein
MRPAYSVAELLAVRASLGDGVPRHDPRAAGFVALLRLFSGEGLRGGPARNARLLEHQSNRFVRSSELESAALDTDEDKRRRAGRLELNRLNSANVEPVVRRMRSLALSHDQLCEFIFDTVIVNVERPDQNQQLRPMARFAVGYASLDGAFLAALAAASLARFEGLRARGSVERLSSAAVWLGELAVDHILPTKLFCETLFNLIHPSPHEHALPVLRCCLHACGERLDRLPLHELNIFYRFLREAPPAKGFEGFLRSDLLTQRSNGWQAAIPRTAPRAAEVAGASAASQSAITASLFAEWDESFARWLEMDGKEAISVPLGPANAMISQEERARVLFARIARGRLERETCVPFTARALAELFQRESLLPALRRILCGITNCLPEISDRRDLVDVIGDVLCELCFELDAIKETELLDLAGGEPDWPCRIMASGNFVRTYIDSVWSVREMAAEEGERLFQRFRKDCPDVERSVEIVCALVLASERAAVVEVEQQMSAYQIGLQIYARLMETIEQGADLPADLRELFRQGNRWTANLRPEGLLLALVLEGCTAARDDEALDEEMYEKCVDFSKALGVSD